MSKETFDFSEALKRMEKNDNLSKKIDAAIRLLQSTCKDEIVELCYSG